MHSTNSAGSNNYGVKSGTSLRFWENKSWINETDPYGWLQWYFGYWVGRRSQDDERQINRWKGIVRRFRGKLVKMIKDAASKFDDYLISPKIRQILLHWVYELTEKDFLLTQFLTLIYKAGEFNFCKKKKKTNKNKHFVKSILSNNLHN